MAHYEATHLRIDDGDECYLACRSDRKLPTNHVFGVKCSVDPEETDCRSCKRTKKWKMARIKKWRS
jgi:hypothetical protein